MEYINIYFLGLGYLLLMICLMFLIHNKLKKTNKNSAFIMILLLSGAIFMVIGFTPAIKQVLFGDEVLSEASGDLETGEPNKDEFAKTPVEEAPKGVEEVEKQTASNDGVKTISKFKPTELKYPIITYESEYSNYKEFEDADGTQYKNLTMINPDGVMMGFRDILESIVALPIDNQNGDDLQYYHGYHYYKSSYTLQVTEGTYTYEKNATVPHYTDFKSTKTEDVSNLDMGHYDFIYKFMPIQYPKEDKLVHVPLLHDDWAAYEDTIMNGQQVLFQTNIRDDGTMVVFENHIVNGNEIPDYIHYELEQLDENAYKLYLYPATVLEDGSLSISTEPSKRNFMIYVTSEDTFELVYWDNNLRRNSITMNRL